jgi:hydrogenase 3 maturation protease
VQRLPTTLRRRLDGAERIAVLGIGSELRADDIAGILVAHRVKELAGKRKKARPRLKVYVGGTAPENLTGDIKRFKPTHMILVDAADAGVKPGKVMVLEADDTSGTSFCTHSLPIKVFTDYLLEYFPCKFTLIGIQPKNLTMGAEPSKAVVEAAESVASAIAELFA